MEKTLVDFIQESTKTFYLKKYCIKYALKILKLVYQSLQRACEMLMLSPQWSIFLSHQSLPRVSKLPRRRQKMLPGHDVAAAQQLTHVAA